jgi:transcriptional antiterminator NusG
MGQKMPVSVINLKDVSLKPAWYTIVTKFNYEKKFAGDLMLGLKNTNFEDRIIEVVVPLKKIEQEVPRKSKAGGTRIKVTYEKIYPTYIFVKAIMNEDIWNYIRNTAGCSTILAPSGYPTTVSEEEMIKIKSDCGLLEQEKEQKKANFKNNIDALKAKFKVGMRSIISSGIFDGYEGNIVAIDFNKGKVNIALSINGVNIETDLLDIKLV